MKLPVWLDRRRFLQIMGGMSLLGAVGSRFGWAVATEVGTSPPKFAYIGGEREIHVYSITADGRFIRRQTIASAHPAAMAISRGNLYVANRVSEYGNLPRGSVEAFAIDARTGLLELNNRLPLSLSGILPQDLAVAPDGRSVVVAVYGGGAYNVLSVDQGGHLARVSAILKETGSGPHALQACAHPSAVTFGRAGRVLTADQGSDRVSLLSISESQITVSCRCEVTAGSGPSSIALAPGGRSLYVAHSLNGSVSVFDYDSMVGRISDCKQTVPASHNGEMAVLAMHPSGKTLYSSHGKGIQAWKIAASGSLEAPGEVTEVPAIKLHATPDGRNLLALTGDAVLTIKINSGTHALATPVTAALVSRPLSIATL